MAGSEREPVARRRRPSAEVREAIIDAARAVFAQKGYGPASMREIAEQAGVYEPMIYRRFDSKMGLFQAAVLRPLDDVIERYIAERVTPSDEQDAPAATEDLVRSFMPPLYELMREEREFILALLSADAFHGDEVQPHAKFAAAIRRYVDRLERHVENEARRRPLPDLDASRALLLSFALVLGLGLLDDALHQPNAQDLGGEPLIEELVKFTLYGVSGRSNPSASAPSASAPSASAPSASAPSASAPSADPARREPDLAPLFDRIAAAEQRAIRAELELEHLKRHRAGR